MINLGDVILGLSTALFLAAVAMAIIFRRPAWEVLHTFHRCPNDDVANRFGTFAFLVSTSLAVYSGFMVYRTLTHVWQQPFRIWLAISIIYITLASLVGFYLAITAWYYGIKVRPPTNHFGEILLAAFIAVAVAAAPIAHLVRDALAIQESTDIASVPSK